MLISLSVCRASLLAQMLRVHSSPRVRRTSGDDHGRFNSASHRAFPHSLSSEPILSSGAHDTGLMRGQFAALFRASFRPNDPARDNMPCSPINGRTVPVLGRVAAGVSALATSTGGAATTCRAQRALAPSRLRDPGRHERRSGICDYAPDGSQNSRNFAALHPDSRDCSRERGCRPRNLSAGQCPGNFTSRALDS